MYNLIIIDDEISTLNLLKKYINWKEFGFDLIGCFSCGYKAMEFISENTVHAIITDISIPDIDGLKLAEYALNTNRNIAIGFISAHRNFEYAFIAANMNSCGYILKPIIKSEVVALCKKMYDHIEKYQQSVNRFNKYNDSKFEVLQNQLKYQEIFTDIILGNLCTESKIDSALNKSKLNLTAKSPCALLRLTIDNMYDYLKNTWTHDKALIYTSINTLVSYSNSDIHSFTLSYMDNIVYVIAFPASASNELFFTDNVEQIVLSIKNNLLNILKMNQAHVDIINFFDNLTQLSYYSLFSQNNAHDNAVDLIDKAIEYINTNYSEITSINTVSDYIHLNPVYFGRYFSKKIGMSFKTYLTNVRIEKAKELLCNSNLKISSIATTLGFNNESYFFTVLKQKLGVTPLQYREIKTSTIDKGPINI